MIRHLLSALVVALLVVSQPQLGQGQSPVRPNFVVFLVDDTDFASLGALRNAGMMPSLTRYFLQTGFGFTESFSVAGFGGPSRATFLTGQYPHNHGVLGFPPNGLEVLNQASTVATWLQSAGYRTGHVGRYVTGYGWWTSASAIPPGWDDWKGIIDPDSNNTVQYRMNLNGSIVDFGALARSLGTELHQVDIVALGGVEFALQAPGHGKPFFLVVAPGVFNLATHPPYNVCPERDAPGFDELYGGSVWGATQKPPDRYLDKIYGNLTNFSLPRPPSFNEADVSDKPPWSWARRTGIYSEEIIDCLQKRYWRKLEGLLAVDDMVGSVMGALEQTGALANTVAIFTSDNGFSDGQHRVAGKGVPYEEAIRVPLLIRPRGSTPLRWISKMVLNTDLAPTIAHLAQITPGHAADGRSLVPLMQNPETTVWRKMGYIESLGDFDPFAERLWPPTYEAIRTDRTRPRLYGRYPLSPLQPNGELYDLTVDPFQMQNRYSDPARQSEREWLQLWLDAMRTCQGVQCQFLESYFYFN